MVIHNFLSYKGFLQLCPTSKSLKFLVLDSVNSLKFYKDNKYRESVRSVVTRYQLSLNFRDYYEFDVSKLCIIHTLVLRCCVNVNVASALGGVHILVLNG